MPQHTARKIFCIIILSLSLAQYLSNRQFWLDESMLAINVRDLSWADLFRPLKMEQSSPIGFLLVAKMSIGLFGTSEMAFRLPGLLIFLTSLRIIYLRKDLFSDVSVAFIFVNAFLIYYSSEFKQYIFDFYAGIMMLAYIRDSNFKSAILFLSLFMWFSNVTLVLVPILAFLYILFEREKNASDLLRWCVLIGSVTLFYFLFVKDHPTRGYMLSFHSKNMGILGDNNLFAFLEYQIGTLLTYTPVHFYLQTLRMLSLASAISCSIFLLCGFALWKAVGSIEPRYLFYLVLAFLSHFAFAALNLYPTGLRFSLDLMPVFAAVFTIVLDHYLKDIRKPLLFLGFMLLTGLLPVLFFDIRTTVFPIQIYEKANVRGMAEYMTQNGIKKVFVYKSDIPQYLFYSPGLEPIKIYRISLNSHSDTTGLPIVSYGDDWQHSGFVQIRPDTVFPGVRNLVFFRGLYSEEK